MKNILLLFILFTGLVSWGQDYDVYLDNFYSENQNKSVNHYTYRIPNHVNSVEITLDPGVVPDGIYIKYGDQEYWSGFMGDVSNENHTQVNLSPQEKKLMYKIQIPRVREKVKKAIAAGDNDYSVMNNGRRNFIGELLVYKNDLGLLESINNEISKYKGKAQVTSIFKNGDGKAQTTTNNIADGKVSYREGLGQYGNIMEQNVSFTIDKESHHSSVEIIVFSPLERKMSDVLIKTCNSCQKPLNNVSLLEEKSNQYYLNGSLYDGSVYELYDSGQLKEEFQVKNGRIEGDKIIYYQDNSFKKENYKDATLIPQLESTLTSLNDKLSSLKKDSSGYYNKKRSLKLEMGDNFYKYKEKYKEGKLKGKKLELYQGYLTYTKRLEEKTSELSEKRNEKKNGEQELKSEKNKSKYVNKIKDVYQYSNGLCSFHKEFDKNEKLVLEEELKDGIRNGSYKRYENGTVKEEGTYLSNKKDGLWTLYSYNGKEVYNYSNDTKEGEYKKYNGDVVVTQGQYKNGLMTGEWIFRYDNGNLKGQGKYIDGDGGNVGSSGIPINGRDGEWILYHENGNVEREFNFKNGLITGISKGYYESGAIWYTNNNIISGMESYEDGLSITYYPNGKMREKSFWKMSKRHGKTIIYYDNGEKKYEVDYKLDEVDFEGNRKTDYNEDGSVKKRWEYSNGEWEKYLSPEEKERRRVEWENHQKELLTMKHKCRRCNSEYVGQGWDYHLADEVLSQFYYVDKNCSVTRSLLREENDYCSKSCASQSCEREKERRGW